MQQERKIKAYRKIYQELKEDSVVKNLGYPKDQKNFEFFCDMGDIHIYFMLYNEVDAIKLTAQKKYEGHTDKQLETIAKQFADGTNIRAEFYDSQITYISFRPLADIPDANAVKQIYEISKSFFEFVKTKLLKPEDILSADGTLDAISEDTTSEVPVESGSAEYPKKEEQAPEASINARDDHGADPYAKWNGAEKASTFSEESEELEEYHYLTRPSVTIDERNHSSVFDPYAKPKRDTQTASPVPDLEQPSHESDMPEQISDSEIEENTNTEENPDEVPDYEESESTGEILESNSKNMQEQRKRRKRRRKNHSNQYAENTVKDVIDPNDSTKSMQPTIETTSSDMDQQDPSVDINDVTKEDSTETNAVQDPDSGRKETSMANEESSKKEYHYTQEVADQRRQMMEELKKTFDERKAYCDWREQTLDKKESVLASQKAEYESKSEELNKRIEEWDIKEAEYANRVMQLDLREQTVLDKNKALDEREAFLNQLEIEKTPEEITRLENRIKELESRCNATEAQLEQANEELKKAHTVSGPELKAKDARIADLESKNNRMAQMLANAEKDSKELEDKITSMQSDLATSSREKRDLRDAAAEAESKRTEIEQKCADVSQKLAGFITANKSKDDLNTILANMRITNIPGESGDGKTISGEMDGCAYVIYPAHRTFVIERPIRRGARYKNTAREFNEDVTVSCFLYEKKIVYKKYYEDPVAELNNAITVLRNL